MKKIFNIILILFLAYAAFNDLYATNPPTGDYDPTIYMGVSDIFPEPLVVHSSSLPAPDLSSKSLEVDFHGQPVPKKKPQQEEELDQPKSKISINPCTLKPTYTVTDISIPIANSDLRLEFRRNMGVHEYTFYDTDLTIPNIGYATKVIPKVLGASWSTNIISRVYYVGNLIIIFDEEGAQYKYVYSNGNYYPYIKTSSDSEGAQTSLKYENGKFIWTKKYNTVYTFSKDVVTDLGDNVLRANSYLESIQDRNGNTIRYEYATGSNYPTKIYYDDGSADPKLAIHITYQDGLISSVTDPMGRVYQYTYSYDYYTYDDLAPNLASVIEPAVTVYNDDNPNGTEINPTTYFTYQKYYGAYFALKTITDPEQNVTTFNYVTASTLGSTDVLISSIQTADGTAYFTREQYNVDELRTRVLDTKGNKWIYRYYGRLAAGANSAFMTKVERTLYDSAGNLKDCIKWEHSLSDKLAINLIKVIDNYNNAIEYKYESEDAEDIYKYDVWNDTYQEIVVASDETELTTKTFGYDPDSRLMNKIVSARGGETTYTLDEKGNRLTETGPEGKILNFTYDLRGITTSSTDADGRVTESSRTYTDTGWTDVSTVKGYNNELTQTTTKVYDLCGNLISETDPCGNITNYEYDACNRLKKITQPQVYDAESGTYKNPTIEYKRDGNGQIVGKKNPRDVWTYYEYDNMYRVIEKRIEMPGDDIVFAYTYDSTGNKASLTDPRGNTVTYSYDYLNRLLSESRPDPNGGTITKTYEYGTNCGNDVFSDTGYLPTKITDPKGIIEEFVYDGAYRLIEKRRNGVTLESNTYDASGNVVQNIKYNVDYLGAASNQVTEMTYDMQERMTQQTVKMDGSGNDLVTQFTLDKSGNKIAVCDPEGHVVQSEYDGAGKVVKEVINLDDNAQTTSSGGNAYAISASATDIVTTKQYDGNGNLTQTSLDNSNGSGAQITTAVYDALNRPISTTDAENRTEQVKYDLNGNKALVIDKRGNTTTMQYDNADRLVLTTMPQIFDGESSQNAQPQISQTYDLNGNVLTATDARGLQAENQYDSLNRLIKTIVHAEVDVETTFEYDKNGNQTQSTFKRGDYDLVTSTTYDAFNRPLTVTDPDNYTESYSYDTVGNKIASTDKRNYTTNFLYDRANRLTKTIMPQVACYSSADSTPENVRPETITNYYKNNWIASVVDANGNATTNTYDNAGRKIMAVNAEGDTVEYAYDNAGNVLQQIVRNSAFSGDQTTSFAYDKMNRKLTETLNPGDASLERVYSWTYDENGNIASRTMPDGNVVNYSYDALNKLTLESYAGATSENRSYVYNKTGAVVKATDETGITEYSYDLQSRILTETKKALDETVLSVVSSAYDKAGNRTSVSYPGAKSLAFAYNKRNLLSTVSDGSDVTGYSYDQNGNRTGHTMANGATVTTVFDEANRVIQIQNMANSLDVYTSNYYMDKVGNRLKITETRNGFATRLLKYTFDNAHRMTSENDNVLGSSVTTTYAYDHAGNRVVRSDGSTTWTYAVDKLNRVISFNDGSLTTTYTYDANGNRLSKVKDGVTHNYVYDRENRLKSVNDGSSDIFTATYDYRTRRMSKVENGTETNYVYDGGDNIQEYVAGSLTKQLVRGTGMGGGIGSVLYTEDGSAQNQEFFVYNAIGSTVALLNSTGNVTATTDYEAFGKEVRETGSTTNTRKFCTKERSASIGLDNFGFRYFDWELGRFVTRDPSGYPDGPNNYLYCHNNPINHIDPLGLKVHYAVDNDYITDMAKDGYEKDTKKSWDKLSKEDKKAKEDAVWDKIKKDAHDKNGEQRRHFKEEWKRKHKDERLSEKEIEKKAEKYANEKMEEFGIEAHRFSGNKELKKIIDGMSDKDKNYLVVHGHKYGDESTASDYSKAFDPNTFKKKNIKGIAFFMCNVTKKERENIRENSGLQSLDIYTSYGRNTKDPRDFGVSFKKIDYERSSRQYVPGNIGFNPSLSHWTQGHPEVDKTLYGLSNSRSRRDKAYKEKHNNKHTNLENY